jgi:quercetin dioxygenase-like cupin family protein
MIIEDILAEISSRKYPFSPETFPKYQDIVLNAGKHSPFTIYPDKSRSIDDLISVVGMITSEKSPLLSILSSFLLHRKAGGIQVYFDDGLSTPPHTHNYAELGYVAEGQFNTHIEGRDYLLNKGDLFLINKNTPHNEYLYRKNSVVLFLSIVNTFF